MNSIRAFSEKPFGAVLMPRSQDRCSGRAWDAAAQVTRRLGFASFQRLIDMQSQVSMSIEFLDHRKHPAGKYPCHYFFFSDLNRSITPAEVVVYFDAIDVLWTLGLILMPERLLLEELVQQMAENYDSDVRLAFHNAFHNIAYALNKEFYNALVASLPEGAAPRRYC